MHRLSQRQWSRAFGGGGFGVIILDNSGRSAKPLVPATAGLAPAERGLGRYSD
jgi:hypothetical protein